MREREREREKIVFPLRGIGFTPKHEDRYAYCILNAITRNINIEW